MFYKDKQVTNYLTTNLELTSPKEVNMRAVIISLICFAVFYAVPATASWLGDPALFDATYYADQNSDVRELAGYNNKKLLHHWGTYGLGEGRRSSPVFDVRYYLQANPDVAKTIGAQNYPEAAQHWYNSGRKEGRPSHPDFHVRDYLRLNKDVARQIGEHNYIKAIEHYMATGYKEGRRGH